MQRIISSSSAAGGVGSVGVCFEPFVFVLPADFLRFEAAGSRSKFFVCWPLVDLPERRIASVFKKT
jgi:hypothetical protein